MREGNIKIFRGCNTRCSHEAFAKQIIQSSGTYIPTADEVLLKISDNVSLLENNQLLQSFSTKKNIAENYCGRHGWIAEIEVKISDLLYPQAVLESLKTNAFLENDYEKAERCDEALSCSQQDFEVFLIGEISADALTITKYRVSY